MATIGTFTASDNSYTGSIKTLTPNVKPKFVTTENDNDKAPDCRICAAASRARGLLPPAAPNLGRLSG
jgi:uncharacterized protein (DUF736 family)